MRTQIRKAKTFPGLGLALKKLKKKGFKLGILTSNSKDNVGFFLKHNRLELFDFIYSGADLFGKDKTIKKMIKNQNLDRKNVVYFGDEVRDIEACQKAGVKIVAVGWGMNSPLALKSANPEQLITSPKDLTVQKLQIS